MAAEDRLVPVEVDVKVDDGTATVTVNGEIDMATVGWLRAGLAEAVAARPSRVVVDLTSTTFIDCAGMEAIGQASREAPPECRVILRSPNRLARKVIELSGIDGMCMIDG